MPRQNKIGFTGNFNPTGVDNTATLKLQALAGLTSEIGELAFNRGAKIRSKEGAIAGAQSVERIGGKVSSIAAQESDSTIFGRAFNEASILAHRAQIGADTKESLDQIQNQYQFDPEGFKKAAEASKKGFLKGMPEELSIIVRGDFDSSVSSRLSQVNDSFFKLQTDKNKASMSVGLESATDDLLNSVRAGDKERSAELIISNDAFINQAVESNLLNPIEAENIKESVRERMQEQEALGEIDRIVFNKDTSPEEQLIKGSEFLENLRVSELKDLSPEKKDSLVRVVASKLSGIANKINSSKNERDIATEKIISNLKVKASTIVDNAKNGETVDLSGIVEATESLHNSGSIKESERTSILSKVSSAQNEIDKIILADKRIISKLSGDNSIVSSQNDVDSFWKRKVQDDITALDPYTASVATANFISQSRMVPTQVKNQIKNNILSGDPELIKQSSDLIDRLDEIPGMSESVVDANQRAFVNQVISLKDSLVPEEAIRIAKEMTDPRDKERVERKKLELSEIKKGWSSIDFKAEVNNIFEVTTGEFLTAPLSGFVGSDKLNPITSDKAAKEYQTLFESYYVAGMGKDEAKAEAEKVMKANWKDSQFGIMKHPPEYFYSVSGQSDYIKDQLYSELTVGTIGANIDKDNIFLISDERTDREASGGNPSYRIFYKNEDGSLSFPHLTDQNGKPSNRWMPDALAEKERQGSENKKTVIKTRESKVKSQIKSQQILKSRFGL